MKSPEQAIFDAMYAISKELGYDTYLYRPIDEVGYPFVELSDTQTFHRGTKDYILGRVPLTINIWGDFKKRNEVTLMSANLMDKALQIRSVDNYDFRLNINASNIRTMKDTTTNTPLWRIIMELEFKFS